MKTFSSTITLIALVTAAIFTNLHCKADDDYPTCDYCPKPTRCNAFAECACPSQNQTLDTETGFCLHAGGYYIAYLEENTLLGTDTFALQSGLSPEESQSVFEFLFQQPFDVGAKRPTSAILTYKDVGSSNMMKNTKSFNSSMYLEKTVDGYHFVLHGFRLPYRPGSNSILNGRPVQVRLTANFTTPGQEQLPATLRWVATDDTTGTDLVTPLQFMLVKKVVPEP